jgi:hypothetical protein
MEARVHADSPSIIAHKFLEDLLVELEKSCERRGWRGGKPASATRNGSAGARVEGLAR